jgi:hypothetical protein
MLKAFGIFNLVAFAIIIFLTLILIFTEKTQRFVNTTAWIIISILSIISISCVIIYLSY